MMIAEDVPEMRKALHAAASFLRDHPMFATAEHINPTAAEQQSGVVTQDGDLRVTRIRRNVHFVSKGEPLLMVADACAFAFRRWLSEQAMGADFVEALLGFVPNLYDYRGPSSAMTFYRT